MFRLENAISTWKRNLSLNRALLPDDVEELERHIRDHVAAGMARGRSEEEAYRDAMESIGDLGGLESEYRKVFWEKVASRRGLMKELIWETSMLANYLRIAFRNLWRNKGYTSINVLGLSAGLACFLLILLFVRDERSYDRHHENAERIVRMHFGETQVVTPTAAGPTMARTIPEVEMFTRIYPLGMYQPISVRRGEDAFLESGFYYADSTVFDVFTMPFVAGSPDGALNRSRTMVITESTAQKYFGDELPIGQTLAVGSGTEFEITGVIEDLPSTSHVQFDLLASFATTGASTREIWNSSNYYTYLLLSNGNQLDTVQAKADELVAQMKANQVMPIPDGFRLGLVPLTSIRSEFEGRSAFVNIFSAIGLLILLIACANYTNLATARAVRRAREVGIRKLSGAHKGQLARQFFGESALLVFVSLILAVLLASWAVEPFNQVAGKAVVFDPFGDPVLLPVLLLLGFVISFIAGFYPAMMLSSFEPARVLKQSSRTGSGGMGFRQVLVVFQFAVTVFLLAGTMVIRFQMGHMQNRSLGFDKENVVVLTISDQELRRNYKTVKEAFLRIPGIEGASAVNSIPGYQRSGYAMHVEGLNLMGEGEEGRHLVSGIPSDEDVAEVLGLQMLAGTGFPDDPGYKPEPGNYRYLVNQTLIEEVGWDPETAVGRQINLLGNRVGQVYGIYQDYHYQSMHEQISPQALFIEPSQFSRLMLKTTGGSVAALMEQIESTWKEVAPGRAFEYTFLDSEIEALYRSDRQTADIVSIFSILAVFIACLGLLGLASYAAEQRTREIGIRKALGANVGQIFILMISELIRVVLIASVIAIPVAWFVMAGWLEDFAYRIDLAWWIFALAALSALFIAIATVSYQSIRAALTDPIESLRYE
jgi:putative ABC transport system permease protein